MAEKCKNKLNVKKFEKIRSLDLDCVPKSL